MASWARLPRLALFRQPLNSQLTLSGCSAFPFHQQSFHLVSACCLCVLLWLSSCLSP